MIRLLLVAVWAVAALSALLQPARAATADSAEWDGFSRFVQLMRGAGVTVEAPPGIDLGQVEPGAGLALLDPPPGDFDGLRLFVQEGGRVLLAVESSASAPLLAAFDLQLEKAPPASSVEGGHPALRALQAPGAGLFGDVGDLLANRPAAVAAPLHLDPAVRYPDGKGFAYHLELGEGELLVVADASLFINLMLDGADNARFAANVGAWLGRNGQTPVWFAGPTTPIEGRYGATGDPPLTGLNQALAELGRILDPDDIVLHLLLAMAIAGTLVFAISVFPGGGRATHDQPPTPSHAERLSGRPGGPGAPENTAPDFDPTRGA